MTHIAEAGRTRLYTRRQRRRIRFAVLLALVGGIGAVTIGTGIASWLRNEWQWPTLETRSIREDGSGLLGLGANTGEPPGALRFPVAIAWPEMNTRTAALIAIVLWLGWLVLLVRPVGRGLSRQTRHRGLARKRRIRAALGTRAARRAGRFTRPGLTRAQRFLLPTSAFGYRLLRPTTPKSRRVVWADWEQRIRIIARTGWGKGARLLIPIIRTLPGPALVASTEPSIFTQTVLARTHRRDPHRFPWLRFINREVGRVRRYPVAVVDFSDPANRWAAGYPNVRWNPIPACVDHTIAHRRAGALVAGVDNTNERGSDSDRFFRSSATEVLAAWLHAAALGHRGIDDLLDWMRHPDDPTPTRILEDHPHHTDPSAVLNLATHLDTRASRTTSGVLRYLALALNSVATTDGRALCTPTPDDPDGFDMTDIIRGGGTVYLLADPNRIDRARPLLSLFAAEMFMAAETVALHQPGGRLRVPFIAVLDELRYGVTVPNLPYVASSQRKYGIGFVYSVQSSSQEEAVYGKDAAALRDAAGVTIVGGIDINLAKELSDRAGTTTVVTAARGTASRSEHTERQESLTVADQQNLADGHAVVLARGLPPFIGHASSVYDKRRLYRRIHREEARVSTRIAAANAANYCLDDVREGARTVGFHMPLGNEIP
ncbi:type IV secretory system conjugative DNA transfer family protein [Nakamurella sp. GG22]